MVGEFETNGIGQRKPVAVQFQRAPEQMIPNRTTIPEE
jgi:hypothetical protein